MSSIMSLFSTSDRTTIESDSTTQPKSVTMTSASNDMSSLIPFIFRYLVIIVIYLFIFSNKNISMMYIEYIIIGVLNFVTILFFYKDMFSIQNIQKSVFKNGQSDKPGDEMNILTIVFIAVIFLTLLLNVATTAIIFAVLEYGRQTVKNTDNHILTPKNAETLMNIKECLKFYVIFIAFFALFVGYSHTKGRTKILIQNIVGVTFSIFTVVSSVYACILSVSFLDNKKYKRNIYMTKASQVL
uniref:Uncharacterized protein n=1 Tax=viral metagenome TaxID=1070528 RepID=A0A6C0DYR9_9ZZZZ